MHHLRLRNLLCNPHVKPHLLILAPIAVFLILIVSLREVWKGEILQENWWGVWILVRSWIDFELLVLRVKWVGRVSFLLPGIEISIIVVFISTFLV